MRGIYIKKNDAKLLHIFAKSVIKYNIKQKNKKGDKICLQKFI